MFKKIKIYLQELETIEYMVVFFAIALQVQVTLFAKGDYLGLRVSAADIFLPFAGLYVIYSLVVRQSNWSKWSFNYMILLLLSLVIVMSLALVNGYIVNGFLSNWALVNKYVGFLILVSYLMLGGWIVTNSRDACFVFSLFMGVFVGFFVLSIIMSVAGLFLQYITPFPLWIADYPWDGFMANRNAFMVVFVMAFSFVIWSYVDSKTILPLWLRYAFWLCLPIFFVFNDSRTGWIASFLLMFVLFAKEPLKRGRVVVPVLILGCLLSYASYFVTTNATKFVHKGAQLKHLSAVFNTNEEQMYNGDKKRYIAVEDGLELYGEHSFLFGAGLGTYQPFQIEKRGKFIEVMDFTALWLLVETGAVGLSVFVLFFIICARVLYKEGYVRDNSSYHRAILTFLIMFAGISILHEIMYMRVLWFAMGLALASRVYSKNYLR